MVRNLGRCDKLQISSQGRVARSPRFGALSGGPCRPIAEGPPSPAFGRLKPAKRLLSSPDLAWLGPVLDLRLARGRSPAPASRRRQATGPNFQETTTAGRSSGRHRAIASSPRRPRAPSPRQGQATGRRQRPQEGRTARQSAGLQAAPAHGRPRGVARGATGAKRHKLSLQRVIWQNHGNTFSFCNKIGP